MNYFDKYTSNSLAGTSNQSCFISDKKVHTSRIFYRVFCGGTYNYSFLFSNITDSRFTELTHTNCVVDSWEIVEMKVAVTDRCDCDENIDGFLKVGFENSKDIDLPEGFFCSDEICLNAPKDAYLCLEISFKGDKVPCHPELQIPSYIKNDGKWIWSVEVPVAHCIGCDRTVKNRIAFLGDSITQGIGPEKNSYEHWCSVLAEKIGDKFSYWNLGIGCGQAQDAASDGSWLFKAKQNDWCFLCFGVNDIIGDKASSSDVKERLDIIIDKLSDSGLKIIIQTIPPFDYADYGDKEKTVWEDVNEYIKNVISKRVSGCFDNVTVLCGEKPHNAKYGRHPNGEGCKKWAEALYEYLKTNLEFNS